MRGLSTLLLAAALGIWTGCGSNAIPVQELTQKSKEYDKTIVTVSGCYVTREGHAVLEPCGRERSVENMVWIDPADEVQTTEILSKVKQRVTDPVPARDSERKLHAQLKQKPDGTATRVVVQGEYQAATVGLSGVGYRRRLIMDRVISIQE